MQQAPTEIEISPTKSKRSNLLTDEEKMELCKRIGYFEPARSIAFWLDGIGKPQRYVQQTIDNHKKSEKWKPIIAKYRQEVSHTINDIPIANKVVRLRELDKIYEVLSELETKTFDTDLRMSCTDRKLKILSQAQQELEGKVLVDQSSIHVTQFNSMSRQQFDDYRLKLVEKIQRYQVAKDEPAVPAIVEGESDGMQSKEGA